MGLGASSGLQRYGTTGWRMGSAEVGDHRAWRRTATGEVEELAEEVEHRTAVVGALADGYSAALAVGEIGHMGDMGCIDAGVDGGE